MSIHVEPPEIVVRVPGPWQTPQEFSSRLPIRYGLSGDGAKSILNTPDGKQIQLFVHPPDDEFPRLFASSCTREPSEADKHGVENYQVNICLAMPGGSFNRAAAALRHITALLDAGGHGVFVDNSGIAHGSDDWRDLANDTGTDGGGPFWALIMTAGSATEVWTVGMHCLGFRDAITARTGNDQLDDFQLRNFLSYAYRSGTVIKDGDITGIGIAASDVAGDPSADPTGDRKPDVANMAQVPMFRIHFEDDTWIPPGHPMHNPYGRCRLAPISDELDPERN